MSDYTNLPRDIADCMKRGGAPLTDDQVIMLSGYLAPVQEQLTTTQAENEALRARVAELSEALQVAVDTPELGGGEWYDMAVTALAERAGGE